MSCSEEDYIHCNFKHWWQEKIITNFNKLILTIWKKLNRTCNFQKQQDEIYSGHWTVWKEKCEGKKMHGKYKVQNKVSRINGNVSVKWWYIKCVKVKDFSDCISYAKIHQFVFRETV